MEVELQELNHMVSTETLLNHPDWKIQFNLHMYASYKYMGAVISQKYKHTALFSSKVIKPQCNYTTTEKLILSIVECQKKFHGRCMGYQGYDIQGRDYM